MWWEGRTWDYEKLFLKEKLDPHGDGLPWLGVGCVCGKAAPPIARTVPGPLLSVGANVLTVLGLPGREARPVSGKLTSSPWIFGSLFPHPNFKKRPNFGELCTSGRVLNFPGGIWKKIQALRIITVGRE